MEWLVLFMLILIGFVLLILEFFVFPGVNVAGILGFACVGIAIYIAYSTMGMTVGHFTLLGTALCGFGVTYYVLRSKTWKRMQLHTQIDSTVPHPYFSHRRQASLRHPNISFLNGFIHTFHSAINLRV